MDRDAEGHDKCAENADASIERSLIEGIHHDAASREICVPVLLKRYGFPYKWNPIFLISKRGCEHTHVLIWVTKDLCWAQDWSMWAISIGCIALLWCFVLLFHAIRAKDAEDIYMIIGTSFWLFANFWWMYWEVTNNDDITHDIQTNPMFLTAFVWVSLYYLILRPFKFIQPRKEVRLRCESEGLIPRFAFLDNWRQYEHLHAFFWIGKDYCWNSKNEYLWPFFLFPTLLIGLDFIYSTASIKKLLMVEFAHYITLLMWLLGNASWSISEVFVENDDDYHFKFWLGTDAAEEHGRWWSSVILICAYVPVLMLYLIWLPISCAAPEGEVGASNVEDEVGEFPNGHKYTALQSDDDVIVTVVQAGVEGGEDITHTSTCWDGRKDVSGDEGRSPMTSTDEGERKL